MVIIYHGFASGHSIYFQIVCPNKNLSNVNHIFCLITLSSQTKCYVIESIVLWTPDSKQKTTPLLSTWSMRTGLYSYIHGLLVKLFTKTFYVTFFKICKSRTIALFLLNQYLISLSMMLTLHLSNIKFFSIKTHMQ